jgi:hypothetical protein
MAGKDGVYVQGEVIEAPRAFGEGDAHVSVLIFIGSEVNPKVYAWGREGRTSAEGQKLLALKPGQRVCIRAGVRAKNDGVQFTAYEVEPVAA